MGSAEDTSLHQPTCSQACYISMRTCGKVSDDNVVSRPCLILSVSEVGASRARQASKTFNILSAEDRTAKLGMLRMFSSQAAKVKVTCLAGKEYYLFMLQALKTSSRS